MMRSFALAIFAACSCCAQTLVQQVTGTVAFSNVLNLTVTTPAAGDLAVLQVGTIDGSTTVNTINGGSGHAWNLAVSKFVTADAEIWCSANSTGGGGTTVTISMTANVAIYALFTEWSGMGTSACPSLLVDQSAGNNGSTAAESTAVITNTNANDLILASAFNTGGCTVSSGPTNSFTNLNTPSASIQFNAYLVTSTTGSYSTTWTAGFSCFWTTVIASFKAAPAVTENLPWNQTTLVEEIVDVAIINIALYGLYWFLLRLAAQKRVLRWLERLPRVTLTWKRPGDDDRAQLQHWLNQRPTTPEERQARYQKALERPKQS